MVDSRFGLFRFGSDTDILIATYVPFLSHASQLNQTHISQRGRGRERKRKRKRKKKYLISLAAQTVE